MIIFEPENKLSKPTTIAKITVLGVGGGGSNMVNHLIDAGNDTINFIVANTDAQALSTSKSENKIQLGVKSTKGLGAGANPEVGRKAAEEDLDKIIENVSGCDIVFLTAGLGGGTGSGALPVIARALKERDILVVAVVTKPFVFEGKRRMKIAQESIDMLKRDVDTLIVVPNQKLVDTVEEKVTLMAAFNLINSILNRLVKSISDIVTKPGHINVDFADIKTIMKNKGFAVIGTGSATGENRAEQALNQALNSSLLENNDIAGAHGILLNISGSSNLGLHEITQVANMIYSKTAEEANIVLGSVIDEDLSDEVTITVIATGFPLSQAITQAPQLEYSRIDINLTKEMPSSTFKYSDSKPEIELAKVDKSEVTIDLNDIDIPSVVRRMALEMQNK